MESTLKKLRVKFIAIIMVLAFAVIAVSFTTVCVLNYNRGVDEVYSSLETSVDRAAQQSESFFGRAEELMGRLFGYDDPGLFDDADSRDGAPAGEGRSGGYGKRMQIGGHGKDRNLMPAAVFKLLPDGSLMLMGGATTADLPDEVLEQVSTLAWSLPYGHGKADSLGLLYVKSDEPGGTYLAFADVGSVSEWQSLAVVLAVVGLCVLVVVFLFSLFFSKRALRPVRESWERQQQFVADASHELKTPLTVMMADTSILMRHPEKTIASQSRWVESMSAEIANMQDLVGDMLLLANSDAGMGDLAGRQSDVDLSKLVSAQLLQFDALAYERGISVEEDVQDGVTVQGDSERLKRLVNTLLDNAFKYVGEGGLVAVQLKGAAVRAELIVKNTGAPIPPEDLPHIFDRFYRVDKARGRDSERSYGLGLAIAREIALSHGGDLTATSSEADGTAFTLTLPAVR